jgi:hypothetical protein
MVEQPRCRKEDVMNRACGLLTGLGLGAGLMYVFDPQQGRRRRALARDKVVSLTHKAERAAEVVGRDLKNRAKGLASGDLSVLAGGKRALANPFRGGWSPSARAVMVGLGAGLFVYGLTRHAPTACVLGTVGLAQAAEGITNAGIDDLRGAAGRVADTAGGLVGQARAAASRMTSGQQSERAGERQSVGAGI